jgi:hypothetical protein
MGDNNDQNMIKFYFIFFCFVFSASIAHAIPNEFYFNNNRLSSLLNTENLSSEGLTAAINLNDDHVYCNLMIIYLPIGYNKSQTPSNNFLVQINVPFLNFKNAQVFNDDSKKQLIAFLATRQPISYCLQLNRSFETQSKKVNIGKTEDNVLKESINRTASYYTEAKETCSDKGRSIFLLNSPANNLPIKYVFIDPKARNYVAAITGFAQGTESDTLNAILGIVFNQKKVNQ